MALDGARTLVGFGFGPIQAGLFLYEAYQSGAFGRLVVAEVAPPVVAAVREAGGRYWLNIAHTDHIARAVVGPVDVRDPAVDADRAALIAALAQAEEIVTAVPDVGAYATAGPGSLHRLLAAGLRDKARAGGPRAVIYAAENHNRAAEILAEHVWAEVPAAEHEAVQASVRFLNTVIGKMSGVVTDPGQLAEQALAPITPGLPRAFLVEAFNRILIAAVRFDTPPAFQRGLTVFAEKSDLLPFEEAKLYGHNATHALATYVGAVLGMRFIADLQQRPDVLAFLRRAFIEESGAALVRKYAGRDPLFTPAGYAAYADDLLARMVNPYLRDAVERVGRDPGRKLGWEDRLIGTLRLARGQGVPARRFAFGAAAALTRLEPRLLTEALAPETVLDPLWQTNTPPPEADERAVILRQVAQAGEALRRWQQAGRPPLEEFLAGQPLPDV